jgi:hypothetical protein
MQGVAEIQKGLAAIFHGRGRNAALRTLAISVTFIRPDVALAHVTNEMSGVATPGRPSAAAAPGTQHSGSCEGRRRLAYCRLPQHDPAKLNGQA